MKKKANPGVVRGVEGTRARLYTFLDYSFHNSVVKAPALAAPPQRCHARPRAMLRRELLPSALTTSPARTARLPRHPDPPRAPCVRSHRAGGSRTPTAFGDLPRR